MKTKQNQKSQHQNIGKKRKKLGIFDYLGIALLFLVIIFNVLLITDGATKSRRLKKIQQEMSLMISRHKTDSTKLAIASADIAEAKATTIAPEPCLKNRENGDTICVKLVPPVKINKARRVSTGEIRRKSTSQTAKRQNNLSSYQAAPDRSVSTSIIEGASRKETFCVNVRNMDGSSFWPQLSIDIGDQVEGAIQNSTHDGHNITIYPTKEIVGLYGVTLDKRIFIRCDLLDRFGPTIIKVSGSPNGWRSWVVAEKIGSYYVADL